MPFPQTPLPLQVELSLDGTNWTDITSDALGERQIRITRGRSDWGQQVDYGRCQLTLKNPDGKYSPRNPRGPYYGKIGRNTPLRVSVKTGTVALDLPGQLGDYASTPDTAALDITGDIDIRVDATLVNWIQPDYPSSGQLNYPRTELIAKRAAGQVSWALYVAAGSLYLEWSTGGSAVNWVWSGADLPLSTSGRLAVRATLDVDNGAGGFTVNFYSAPTINGPWTLLDGGSFSGTTSIFNSTAPVRIGHATEQTTWRPALGRVHSARVYSGIDGTLVASPDFSTQPSGTTSFTDATGRTWTLAGGAEITNRKVRFVGEIASWTPRWGTGGKDATTDIEAAGVLRRLGIGAVAKSPFYREMTSPGRRAAGVVAYWPMEDGSTSTKLASAFSGHPAMSITSGVTPAAYTAWVASDAIPTLTSGSMRVTVPPYTPNATAVGYVGFFACVPAGGVLSTQRLMSLTQTGTATVWSVWVNTAGALAVRAYDADGNQILDSGFGTDSVNGLQKYVILQLSQGPSQVTYQLTAVDVAASMTTAIPDNNTAALIIFGSLASYTTSRITQVRFGEDAGMTGTALGHLVIGNASRALAATGGAIVGWNAEDAASRAGRIGLEEGIHSYPTRAGDEQCGPQGKDTALTIARAAGDVDSGILAEQRRVLGLRYVTRASMYNQAPTLVLDYTGRDGLVAPLDPAEDDQAVTNDVTVQRADGASARLTLDTGALSTLPPPSGIGPYPTSATAPLLDDSQPLQLAGWLLHVGTWDEVRIPVVTVNLAAAPAKIEQAAAVDVGSRLQILHPPVWLPADTIDLIAQGYIEVLDQFTWTISYNCSPAGPWTVGQVAVYEDFEDTTYALTMTSGGTLPWTRSQTHYNSGTWSLRSGAITNNQTSDVTFTMPVGATKLTFWYYTSSEASGPGFEGDRLLVFVDGVQVLRAQGSTPWTPATVPVSSASTVTFRYIKDNSASGGEDAVWIDDLTVTTLAPMRADTAGSQLAAAATSTATSLQVATTSGPVWVTTPVEFPFDITVGGERMTVTAVTGSTSPQTFTVVRSVNGVVKAQTAGTDVRLADPAYVAL
ncbi:hypothetical protein G3I51_23755 [Streptomyces sp. SID9944]|nr:hypothetical protein [Streptomyces sp. SID9944]